MSLLNYSEVYSPTYTSFVDISKRHERAHWTSDEVKLQQDVEQWKTGKITDDEKYLIKNILRLFTQSDLNVGAGYLDKLIPYVKNNEARGMLTSFACREFEHQRAYALLSDTLGLGEDFYHEFLEYSEMKEKHEYMIEDIGKGHADFAKYLAKQTLVEGVSLFAMFVMLLNFDRNGKLPGMSDINRWSFSDESIHVEGNCLLFRKFLEEHPRIVNDEFKKDIYDSIRQLIDLEDKFIEKCFSLGGVKGLTEQEVKDYIRYVANYRLTQLGLKPNWAEIDKNPIPWVDSIMGSTFGNFFERTISEYSKGNLSGEFTY